MHKKKKLFSCRPKGTREPLGEYLVITEETVVDGLFCYQRLEKAGPDKLFFLSDSG